MSDVQKPRKLGRGLSSMIAAPVQLAAQAVPEPAAAPPAASDDEPRIVRIPLASVAPGAFQPRRVFDAGTISELAASIRQVGVMQPLLVRPSGPGRYELVAGERRWRAAQEAGLTEAPAIVASLTNQEAAQWGLIENLQREDLGAVDKALAFRRLIDEFGLTQSEVAMRVGLDRSSISNHLRLLDLEPAILDLVESGSLSFGHARALLALPAGPQRIQAAKDAADQGWSVRRVETLGATLGGTLADTAAAAQPGAETEGEPTADLEALLRARARERTMADLEHQIGEQLGTKAFLQTSRGGRKGRLLLEFYSLDHFDGLLAKMGVKLRT